MFCFLFSPESLNEKPSPQFSGEFLAAGGGGGGVSEIVPFQKKTTSLSKLLGFVLV